MRQDTQCPGFFCRLPSVADIKFPIDIVQLFFYRIRRNEQLAANFLRWQPLDQEVQDLEFALRQRLDQRLGGGGDGVSGRLGIEKFVL